MFLIGEVPAQTVTSGSMQEFVTSIGSTLTSANLWSEVGPIAAIVGVLVLFKLGYNVLKKNVNNATKPNGKAMN